MSDALEPLRIHPAFSLADVLAEYVGIDRDLIQFLEFLSLAAGRMVMPINLDIQTDNVTVDLHIANRILDLRHGHVARADTRREFRELERGGFYLPADAALGYVNGPPGPCPIAAILVRGNHRLLHREVSEYISRVLSGDFTLPSLWRVTDLTSTLPPVPATLRVQTVQANRTLDDFGHAYAGYRLCAEEDDLAGLIQSLPTQPSYNCAFRSRYRGAIRPELMLVFERLLAVLAALRITLPTSPAKQSQVLLEDYEAVRALLICLPLTPIERELTPQALQTAAVVHEAMISDDAGLALPDLSQFGQKWFTRHDAMSWTDLSYNAVKKQLCELEGEGILVSTVAESNRERGRQIHLRFADGQTPPFAWKNPFEALPALAAVSPGT